MKKKIFFDAADYLSIHAPQTGIYRYIEGLLRGIQAVDHHLKPEVKVLSESRVSDDFSFLHDAIIYTSSKENRLRRYSFKYPSLIHYFYKLERVLDTAGRDYDIYHVLDIGNFTDYKKNVTTFYDITPILHPEWHMDFVIKHHSYKLEIARKKQLKIVCISENTKIDLIGQGIKEENIRVTELALPVSLQKNIDVTDEEINRIKIKYPHPFFLSVCTIEPRKNIIVLINAFISIKQNSNYDDVKLVLVGKHGWGEKTFPDHPDIIFTDFVDDRELACLYRLSLGFIYPSLYEGFGLPVLEGMALGAPVIASNVSSIPEVGGDSILYINPADKEDLIDKMTALLEDPTYSDSLRKKGLERAKLFSWDKTAAKTLDAYEYFFPE